MKKNTDKPILLDHTELWASAGRKKVSCKKKMLSVYIILSSFQETLAEIEDKYGYKWSLIIYYK